MANYSGYSSKILVSNIPNNFSKLKLKLKLEEVVGDGCIEDYEQINDNLVKITVVNIGAQQNSLDSCISLTFGGQKHELKLKYLEEDNAGTGIYTFLVSEAYPKPILNYLSKSRKHTEEIKKMLEQHNLKLLHISPEKIEVQNAVGFIKSEEDCGECIQRFLKLYSSWNEKLENSSVADIKHIKTVLAKYKDECYYRWFNDSSTILVIGPKTIVEEVQNLINDHLVKSPKKIPPPENSTALSFNYEGIYTFLVSEAYPKPILNYLSKSPKHTEEFKKMLEQYNLKLLHISSEKIEVQNAGEFVKSEENCGECIQRFLELYSSWNEKLENCSVADIKHIKTVLAKYKDECYHRWFNDSSTILVIGPKTIVEEIQILINNHLEKSPKNMPPPANSTAQPFNYEDVEPAIMRFVSFAETYKQHLSLWLTGLANVEIVEKDKTLSVHVSPTQISRARLHHDFETACRIKLEQFFKQFAVWKGKVDLTVIARQKHHRPHLFQTKNFQDHFVQWFMDTGVVNVVGISWKVQRCRCMLEKLLGASQIHSSADSQPFPPPASVHGQPFPPVSIYGQPFPPPAPLHGQPFPPPVSVQGQPFLTPVPIHGQPFPTPVSILHVLRPQQVMNAPPIQLRGNPVQTLHPLPVSPTANGVTSNHYLERSRKLSSEDYSDDSSSSSKGDSTTPVQFDTKDYKPAVLKFVFNDAVAKKDLGSCCGKLAKVSITNDQGQIKVHITFRKKHPSDADKSRALEQVGNYFKQFSAETNKI
uniref:uncharacterized protein LOC120327173 n=1 Tax=Styela clava TaxID=7725 RepID=UPI00193A4A08|nr:uncharacterized protein LOC120327173 [Styela clava]